jgi:hypothetical protein
MSPDSPISIINNIPGVSIKRADQGVEVCFMNSLTIDEWHEVEIYIDRMLGTGSLHFNFCLQQLMNFTSHDIGMWVTMNAKIKARSAQLNFVVVNDSNTYKYMRFANLDKIFSIVIMDPDEKDFKDQCAE